jgi:phasin family protein
MKGETVPGEDRRKRTARKSEAVRLNPAGHFDFEVMVTAEDFRFSQVDLERWMAVQRRNVEAFAQANQLTVEAAQAVTRRQIEIARQTLEDMSALWRDLAQTGSTEDRIAKNTEHLKRMLESRMAQSSRDISMMAMKAGTEVADILRQRAAQEEEIGEALSTEGVREWGEEAARAAGAFQAAAKNLLSVTDDALASMRSRRDQTQALLRRLEASLETPRGHG